jgi:hypothetical protein
MRMNPTNDKGKNRALPVEAKEISDMVHPLAVHKL